MPWARNSDLPEPVRSALPDDAQTRLRQVANGRLAAGDSDAAAIRQGWYVVGQGWERSKDGGAWVQKAGEGNPNHDERGRFASGDGGGGATNSGVVSVERLSTPSLAEKWRQSVAMYGSDIYLTSGASDRELIRSGAALARGKGSIKDARVLAQRAGLGKDKVAVIERGFRSVSTQDKLRELSRSSEAARRAEQARLRQPGAKYKPEAAGFRGSPAARHQRQELSRAPVWARAEARKGIMQEFVKAEVAKVDEELGLVFGWAITCKVEGEPYFDKQNDHIPEDSMLRAAADFMQHSRVAKEMHSGEQVGDIIFAFPLTGDLAKKMDIVTKFTGLMIAMKPSDPVVLAKFRDGTLMGFSIGGQRVEDEDADEDFGKAGEGNPNHDERGQFSSGSGGGSGPGLANDSSRMSDKGKQVSPVVQNFFNDHKDSASQKVALRGLSDDKLKAVAGLLSQDHPKYSTSDSHSNRLFSLIEGEAKRRSLSLTKVISLEDERVE